LEDSSEVIVVGNSPDVAPWNQERAGKSGGLGFLRVYP
jgi:hypothetical protein